jgi:hypothetical protein
LLEISREADGQRLEFRFNLGSSPVHIRDCEGSPLIAINGASKDQLPPYAALITEITI